MEDRTEKPNFSSPKATPQVTDHSVARRNLLKLGAAGMPMVLTLKASARQAVISQLQCVIVLPRRMRMLVDSDGNVWAGTRRVRYQGNQGGWNLADIASFKGHSNTVSFTDPNIPNNFIPTGCPPSSGGNSGNDDDCDDDDDYGYDFDSDYDSASAELDALLNQPVVSEGDGMLAMGRSDDDDDDDDDDCGEITHVDCGFALYTLNRNDEVTPADFIDGCSWSFGSNAEGLFVALSRDLVKSGVSSGWPGISCVLSILTYLDQQC